MIRIVRSTVIDASTDRVWALLRDFNGHDRWHPAVARSAIELVTGGRLQACANPRCVQYHLGDGGRDYCSAACANRARVARHEARVR